MKEITVTVPRPDDWHTHLREGEMCRIVAPYSNLYGRVVAMGNLVDPVTTHLDVRKYRMEILRQKGSFIPVMSIMLVNGTTPEIITRAYEEGARVLKLIPGGTSTNSKKGVPLASLKDYYPILGKAEKLDIIFSGHWELAQDPRTGKEIPELERESKAIPYLQDVIKTFPKLKIIVEHVSTVKMVEVVEKAPPNVAATITAHHIGPIFYPEIVNGCNQVIKPHYYCKPVIKNRSDALAVMGAMMSGNPKFFFGSDPAAQLLERKLANPPAAGIFSPAVVALPWLFQNFVERKDDAHKLFTDFTWKFGADFYGLPRNTDSITFRLKKWRVPKNYDSIVPFLADKQLKWQVGY